VFSERERRVLAYAEAVSETPPAVTDWMVAALLDDLGAPALLELTARIGSMNMMARSNIALGIRSEEFAEACGLEPLARPSAVAS
jgi:alkylhydroperoxidase family enzyme